MIREFSSISASNSVLTTMVSKWSTEATMARVFSLCPRPAWKYWLTRFFSFLALPT